MNLLKKMLIILWMISLTTISVQANTSTTTIEEKKVPLGVSKSIDFYRNSLGIVDVYYNTTTDKKVKLLVQHDTKKYYYNLSNKPDFVSFPLQLGNGSYDIKIYENTVGSKYRKVQSKSGSISLKDQKVVFLNSIQQIEWYNDDVAIEFAKELLDTYKRDRYPQIVQRDIYGLESIQLSDREKIDVFYNYVVENISYDYDKIQTLKYDYIPDIDTILDDQSGICYDYSVLLSAMLRSQGIPSKLVKGYSSFTDVYHAWNEIYLSDEDRWVVVDTTFDSYMYRRRRNYSFEKDEEDYTVSYAY